MRAFIHNELCFPEYLEKCDSFEHEFEASCDPEGCLSDKTIPSLDAYRVVLASTPEKRRARVEHFFNPAIKIRQRLGQGLHDRGEASVFAEYELNAEDKAALNVHLPLHVRAISVAHKHVTPGNIWDVSVRGEAWGLDDMEELYVTLNVGVLELAPGAQLVVRGNVFAMTCQRLIVHEPAADWQIGIMPTPHSVDFGHGPADGPPGCPGADGMSGRPGRALRVEESFIGPRACEPIRPEVLDGGHGGSGEPGTRGGSGRNGGMCKLADIVIRDLSGRLTVFAQAGRGGDGGDGGPGGAGGDGGNGIPGPHLVGHQVRDGHAGSGGHGGDGGDGGAAGSGGIASNIYLTVPADAAHRVTCHSLESEPGVSGLGGEGGRAGQAGVGPGAQPSVAGNAGRDGPRGRARPAPWMFVNEMPVAGTGACPSVNTHTRDQ